MTGRARLDGRQVAFTPGETILAAAGRAGIDIPTLCHREGLTPEGGCRLCLVEVSGASRPQAACHTVLADGAEVVTDTPALRALRRDVLALEVAAHPPGALAGRGEVAVLARSLGVETGTGGGGRQGPVDDSHPYLLFRPDACVTCRRCVRACEEIQGRFVYGIKGRGANSQLVAGPGERFADGDCVACGACVDACPTGAITDRDRLDGAPPGPMHDLDLWVLRGRLPRGGVGLRRPDRPRGRCAGRRREPRSPLPQGALRPRMAGVPRPGHRAAPPRSLGRAATCLLGGGDRLARRAPRVPARRARSGRVRRLGLVAVDQRGVLPAPEAGPVGRRHEQRRLLRPCLPLLHRDRAAGRHRDRRRQRLLRRHRAGTRHRRGRRQPHRGAPGCRREDPPGGPRGHPTRRDRPAADRARPGGGGAPPAGPRRERPPPERPGPHAAGPRSGRPGLPGRMDHRP